MCGFIGIIRPTGEVFPELCDGLIAIQHRGQDAAGISTFDRRFHLKRGSGLVRDVFVQEDTALLTGSIGIGHVRYPTVGGGGVENAQPFIINHPYGIALAHNGNLTNYHELCETLRQRDRRLINSTCDAEIILNVLADELSMKGGVPFNVDVLFDAIKGSLQRLKGAYSVVGIVAGEGMFAFRDPFGIKPILMAERVEKDGSAYCFASESVVPDLLDFHKVTNIQPGEAVFVALDGTVTKRKVIANEHHPCLFEWVYFARPDSFLDKVSVYKTRQRLGEKLAEVWKETGLHADVVIPIPESATTAAAAMARALNLRYREAFVKNRYIGRTFIMPNDKVRRTSIRAKLNPIQIEFEGKDVLLVDDSIVRGNTSKQIIQLARASGARKVYFASYSPPLRHPCVYGIDMSTRNEFIAKGRDDKEIAAEIGADAVVYQPLENLEDGTREGNADLRKFCNACFTGKYPTGDVTPEMLAAIEGDRLAIREVTGSKA
ncbi:MAG: amidophosphoribosyltransferase [Planctomycetes bacterium]|nr:amidophosphoribosyltransferase [Planctomycetota bacterium]MCC7172604.1 amidophosphoribosyltransferase [Planctomycetota bacterium]